MPPALATSDLPLWFVRVFAFCWGAIWGSFANVVIYRWPRELSLTRPASRCPHCEHPIRAYDNVPILGWLWLGGKCRDCKAPISPRYPFVEALYALSALIVAERIVRADMVPALSVATALFLLRFGMAWGLLTIAFVDLEAFLIPDFISIGGTAIGIAASFLLPGIDWTVSVKGALTGFGVLLGVELFWKYVFKRDGMGRGDAKLLAMIGAFQGPVGVMFALFAGSVQGTFAAVVSRLTGWQLGADPSLLDEDDEEEGTEPGAMTEDASTEDATTEDATPSLLRTRMPFGPFLALASLEYLLGAEPWVRPAIEAVGHGMSVLLGLAPAE